MTQQATGDGRSLPKSLTNLVKKFVRQATDGSTDWATGGDVLKALAEVDQAALAASDYASASVFSTSGAITFATGSTYIGTAALAATLPYAAAAASIAFAPLRRISAATLTAGITITVKDTAGTAVANVGSANPKTFDTNGDVWFPIN